LNSFLKKPPFFSSVTSESSAMDALLPGVGWMDSNAVAARLPGC
jgi:hypothetical protein